MKSPNNHEFSVGQISLSADPAIKKQRGRPKKYPRSPFSLTSLTLDSSIPSPRARFSLQSSYIGSYAKKHEEKFAPTAISSKAYGRSKKTSVITDVVSKRRRMKSILKQTISSPLITNGHINDLNQSGDNIINTVSTKIDVSTSTSPILHQIKSTEENANTNNAVIDSIPFNSRSSVQFSSQNQPISNNAKVTCDSHLLSYPGISSNYHQLTTRSINEVNSQSSVSTIAQTVTVNSSRLSLASSSVFPSFHDPHGHYSSVCSTSHSQYMGNFEANLLSRLLPQAEAAICAGRVAGLSGPHTWTPEMVAAFIATLPGCNHLSHIFFENEIDGPALLCLEQQDLMAVLNLKLGPAVKIFGAIRTFRRTMMAIPYSDLSADHEMVKTAVASCFKPSNRDVSLSPHPSTSFIIPMAVESVITRTISNTAGLINAPRLNGLPTPTDMKMPLKNMFD